MTNCITYFIVSFILLLRLSKRSLFDVISRQHGRLALKSVLSLIADEKKKVKCKEDLAFLISCKTFAIFPKFLRFKLYKRTLQSTNLYRHFQNQLLDNEIKEKKRRISALCNTTADKRKSLKSTKFFQYFWLSKKFKDTVSAYREKITEVHSKKLGRLGITTKIEPCDPDKVIFNLSS